MNISPRPKLFIVAGALATLSSFAVYGAVQQTFRNSANDPQVQLSEDGARALSLGKDPLLGATETVDIVRSLAPFIVIYTKEGVPVRGTGVTNGTLAQIPVGIFSNPGDEQRFAWQPKPSLRFASILTRYRDPMGVEGFVLAARSLRESEARTFHIGRLLICGWIATLLVVAALSFFL